ncbi:MAG: cyclic nucleotide-binding domain-containing protein [Rhodothermales bacterium]
MQRTQSQQLWELVVILVTTAATLTIPLALIPGWHDIPFVRPVLLVTSLVYAIDAWMSWRRRGGSGTAGIGTFVLADLLPALPLYVLAGWPSIMLLRLGKLYRVWEYAREMVRRRIQRAAYLRLAFFSYGLALTAHWIACGWISLRSTEAAAGPSAAVYVHALYWCVSTLTTVGYGDVVPTNNAQSLYAVLVMILGVGVYAYVIGNIATILTNMDPARTRYLQQMERLGAFVRYRRIPSDLQRRIREYYDYVWERRLGYDESLILGSLPAGLRDDVALFLKRDFLERVPLFVEVPDAFVRNVALKLTSEIFTPGDYVVRAGEAGREMYFIVRGSVEVLSPDGNVLTNLSEGDFFGEIALLEDRPRNASVRAIDYCDVYRLSRSVFDEIAAHHPGIADAIRLKAGERRAGEVEL